MADKDDKISQKIIGDENQQYKSHEAGSQYIKGSGNIQMSGDLTQYFNITNNKSRISPEKINAEINRLNAESKKNVDNFEWNKFVLLIITLLSVIVVSYIFSPIHSLIVIIIAYCIFARLQNNYVLMNNKLKDEFSIVEAGIKKYKFDNLMED